MVNINNHHTTTPDHRGEGGMGGACGPATYTAIYLFITLRQWAVDYHKPVSMNELFSGTENTNEGNRTCQTNQITSNTTMAQSPGLIRHQSPDTSERK